MEMNQTPSGERLHIGFFGKRNAGKSSLVNAVTGQNLSIVSDVMGTTTDPVLKSMELLPLGPVVIMDTPGLDDEGALGALRVGKTKQMLRKTDIGILVADGRTGIGKEEQELIKLLKAQGTPFLTVYNKADLCGDAAGGPEGGALPDAPAAAALSCTAPAPSSPVSSAAPAPRSSSSPESFVPSSPILWVSAATGQGIRELKETIGKLAESAGAASNERRLLGDLITPGDAVILVVPIDKAAPKGRLILPQQQAIRDILESGASALVCRESELADTFAKLKGKPALVVTDSQVFPLVARLTPKDVPMTSFSILFARYKGDLQQTVEGARVLDAIADGDKILISEGCTHHRQCGDIGTEKLPAMIRRHTGAEPEFFFTSGTEFPDDLAPCRLIIHCGGCMLNQREMKYRLAKAASQGVPMTNYGIAMAHMGGILERSLAPLKGLKGK